MMNGSVLLLILLMLVAVIAAYQTGKREAGTAKEKLLVSGWPRTSNPR